MLHSKISWIQDKGKNNFIHEKSRFKKNSKISLKK